MYSACLPEHRRNREMGNVDLPENLLTRAYPPHAHRPHRAGSCACGETGGLLLSVFFGSL